MRILLVEDNEEVVEVLSQVLSEQNYTVDVAKDGEVGWELAESCLYDLVLLDVMLPKLDGISFCKRLRKQKNSVLVMLLTARDTITDKLHGLDSGADDYMVKPFNIQELVARIRVLLRRVNTEPESSLACGELHLDPVKREVSYAGQPLQFSRKEYLILELFLRNQQRVFSRSAIVDHVWSFSEEPPDEATVKSHIKNIRRELKAVGAGTLIETLYGQGYRINPAYSKPPAPESSTQPQTTNATKRRSQNLSPAASPAHSNEQFLNSTVMEVWQRTKKMSLEKATFLKQVVQSLKTDTFNQDLHQKAITTAHKLAGSLGTFGLDTGSYLALKIEHLFQDELKTVETPFQQPSIQQLESLILALHGELEAAHQSTAVIEPTVSTPSTNLLIVDADRLFAEHIATEAAKSNMQVTIAEEWCVAQTQIKQNPPDIVLLDLALLDATESADFQLTTLAACIPNIPVVAFSSSQSRVDPVVTTKVGIQLFLQKPIAPSQVLKAIVEILQPLDHQAIKVLAVDDDLQILLTLKALLKTEGIQLCYLQDSTQFWQVLETQQPDLLILDINMPTIDGFDLCRAVRHSFQWNWLPIIVLTVQSDRDIVRQIFAAGADDYVMKPIAPQDLLTRILNRLKRSYALKRYAEKLVGSNTHKTSSHL